MFKLNSKLNIIEAISTCKNVARTLTNNADIAPVFTNRNPRNLEKMRIGYKPDGYHIEKPGKCYWHKLELTSTNRYVVASIHHFENGQVLKASTSEWALKKQLYSSIDSAAFINLARVLAERCLKSGITEIRSDIVPTRSDGKIASFLKTLEENGVKLEEATQFKAAHPWDQLRPEKPWEVTE